MITAALIILLSAFNGIEKMIENLYSEYDTDITIRLAKGKTFSDDRIDLKLITETEGVVNYARAYEEVVILKHEQKWVNAKMVGVDSSFLKITNMSNHMVDGLPFFKENGSNYALVGATLLDKLEGFVPVSSGHESLICYAPKREIKIRPGRSPFNQHVVKIAGRINFNREVNAEAFIIPLDYAQKMVDNSGRITAIYVDVDPGYDNSSIKKELQQKLGEQFVVKTNYEKNELIFKTSKTERIIVLVILLFIFILAAFNLVASITMLFVEKEKDLGTLKCIGADNRFLFNIFFIEGLLIAFKGIVFGALVGYGICFAQLQLGILTMPNSNGEAFPIVISLFDGVLILSLVSILSVLFSYLPVLYLVRSNLRRI